MNRLNLQRLEPLGIRADIDTTGSTPHVRLQLPGLLIAHGLPNDLDESTDFAPGTESQPADQRLFKELDEFGATASRGLHAVGLAVKRITDAHARLAPQVAAEESAAAISTALASLGTEHGKLAATGRKLEAQDAEFHVVPEPDAAGAVIDGELRGRFLALDAPGQARMLRDLARPEFARALLALKRSPLPLGDEVMAAVGQAWRAHVAAQRPDEAAALAKAKAAHEWAAGLVQHLAKTISEPRNLTPRSHAHHAPTFNRYQTYTALRGTGGEGMFGFSEGERQQYEHRIAATTKTKTAS